MLDDVVRYLHQSGVPFQLASYPSPETAPAVAHPVRPGQMMVDTELYSADGRTLLVAFPHAELVDVAAIALELGAACVVPVLSEELSRALHAAAGPIPPLGRLYGVPLIVDERVSRASNILFQAFSPTDYVEVPYEDWARVEQPRLASFASGGALPPGPEERTASPGRA